MTKSHGDFAAPGDSGSLVIRERDGRPIGLVHAVRPDGITVVCKAAEIERLLQVRFARSASAGPYAGLFDPTAFPTDPKERFDVLIEGISIGHQSVTAGTLGAFVWDMATGELLGLTNAHVAAPFAAAVGDPIYQPGPFDIRNGFHREPTDSDIAGYLVRWMPISSTEPNLIDAAVFRPVRPAWPGYIVGGRKRPLIEPVL